ncbi:AMP-binding protein [Rhodococcus erythropolis]
MGLSVTFATDAVVSQAPPVPLDKPALACGEDDALTWGQLREKEMRYAHALRRAGIAKGDRVGVLLRNSTDYVCLFLACARVGAIAVRLNWRLTAPELQFALEDSETETLVLDAEFGPVIAGARSSVPVRRYLVRDDGFPLPEWANSLAEFTSGLDGDSSTLPALGLDDPVSLLYTSGTTGRPKGVIYTHGNMLWISAIQIQKWKFDSSFVGHTAGPLFHVGGFEAFLLPALHTYGTAVMSPSGSFTVEGFLAAARKHRSTSILLYPGMVAELLSHPDPRSLVPDSVEQILTGGDLVAPWLYDRLEKMLPGVRMDQTYGLTEGGALNVTLDHADAPGHETSIGRAQAMSEVAVVRTDGTPTAPDEVGEICVRSGGVSVGYWHRPDADKDTFVDGWCHTGDLARVSADGFLYLAGRAKDMIRSGGENVYPAEIEQVLNGHAAVAESAVIGVPDETFIEVGVAVVVLQEGHDIDSEILRDYLLGRLAKFKVPKHFTIIDALPRNANGKVQKSHLRHLYGPSGLYHQNEGASS